MLCYKFTMTQYFVCGNRNREKCCPKRDLFLFGKKTIFNAICQCYRNDMAVCV